MSETNMVCNGYKEHNINKCSNTVNDILSLDKSSSKCENSSKESMTIGIPFRDFDHMYASSGEESQPVNLANMNAARTYLHSCHLNIIEEQARIIETHNQELVKLKKENESLHARIERMNRRLNLNQSNRRSIFNRNKFQYLQKNINNSLEDTTNYADSENEDVHPRIRITPLSNEENEKVMNVPCSDSNNLPKSKTINSKNEKEEVMGIDNTCTTNIRLRFHRNELAVNDSRRKGNKMVRFVEAKRSNCNPGTGKPRRLSTQTVDEKLKMENAVLFLNSAVDDKSLKTNLENDIRTSVECPSAPDDDSAPNKKKMKLDILTTSKPYYMATREDLYDPVTYTPTALEVPSFRIIEKVSIDSSNIPQNYNEDVSLNAARERHLRFESDERKRKKWDVQRIRELRQNERLKERLRRRKSRWNKLESPNSKNNDTRGQITTLFPDIRSIEKIVITDLVPVTALGCSIPKIPLWGSEFHTNWKNDGTMDGNHFEDSPNQAHQPHHKETKSKAG